MSFLSIARLSETLDVSENHKRIARSSNSHKNNFGRVHRSAKRRESFRFNKALDGDDLNGDTEASDSSNLKTNYSVGSADQINDAGFTFQSQSPEPEDKNDSSFNFAGTISEGETSSKTNVTNEPNLSNNTFGSMSDVSDGKNQSGFENFSQTLNSGSSSSLNQSSLGNLSSSSGSLLSALPKGSMNLNGLFFGFLPDDGSSGGTRQTMAQLNAAIRGKSAVYGWYSQAKSGVPFDGSQLLDVIDDVKASNSVFQPAVMPIGGWQGLTAQDNSQAIAIANVMKTFTDRGIPVWLRFAHEVNYYQTDGTYQGTAADFKAGWAAVSSAIKQIAPDVKMWWTPNVDSAENYKAYEPDDMSTVDLVGIDYYPKRLTGNDFLSTMKDFHDRYAVDGRKFAIGETGLGWPGTIEEKYNWLQEICAAKASLPEFVSAAWFNFDKEYDYKIAGESTLNQKFTSFLAARPI
uniref:GH26 domain-containing protein n=1 Tax=Phakopsora pachyrhizi TaxID=170000 RepID=A0A0S1MK75_PHAPC